MNVIYNSDNYCVIEYPPQRGYEVVDKHAARGAFFQDGAADRFVEQIENAAKEDPSVEHFDDLLESLDALLTIPLTYH